MSIICPTVLAQNQHDFRSQIERVSTFSKRIQIDLADGKFTSNKTVDLKHVWWPEHLQVDLHIMYQDPVRHLKSFIKLKPHMVIIHAESDGNFLHLADALHGAGIKVGVAVLQRTNIESIAPILKLVDHVLIFGGTLGHFGGHADLRMLDKVKAVKLQEPKLEVGWDGGIHDLNIATLARSGVDVLNVGGFIQHAPDPSLAYAILNSLVERS